LRATTKKGRQLFSKKVHPHRKSWLRLCHTAVQNTIVILCVVYVQNFTRCSAIAERPRCRVRYSFGQKWKNWETSTTVI